MTIPEGFYSAVTGEPNPSPELRFVAHVALHTTIAQQFHEPVRTWQRYDPCPYCGELPPGWVVPHSEARLS